MDKEEIDFLIDDEEKNVCDDCGEECDALELQPCSGCRMKLCRICRDLHADEHYNNIDDDDEEKQY